MWFSKVNRGMVVVLTGDFLLLLFILHIKLQKKKPNFWTRPKTAIKRAYKKTDDEILDGVVSSRGGSTAVTAILINREKLIVANVGDSRAIMYGNGKAKQITVDHEPQKERELVESRGGFVSQRPGMCFKPREILNVGCSIRDVTNSLDLNCSRLL